MDREDRKMEDYPPSKVLHFANLSRMTEANDIIDAIMNLKMPRPVNIMILPSEQALVEMPTVEDSIHMVDSTGRTIYVRGTPARIAYSKSESIRMKGGDERRPYTGDRRERGPPPVVWPEHRGENIVMMNIYNPKHEVNVDVLHQILSPYGVVNRIIIFEKGGVIKSLIEFDRPEHAARALTELNGKDIYDGCNHIRIEYSTQKSLNVRRENDKCADYTRARDRAAAPPAYDRFGAPDARRRSRSPPRRDRDYPEPPPRRDYGYDMPPPPPRDPFDVYDRPPMGIGQMPVNVPPQYAPAPYAPIPDMRGRDDYPPRRDDYRRDDYPPRRDDYRRDDAPRDRSYDDRHERRRSPSPRRSWDATDKCVLYVRDLPPQMNTPERVFALFCTYGKIEKIKIIKDKCAIVQFVNNAHAATAREYLDSTFAFGSNIRVHHSTGYDKINTPRDNTDPNIADYKDSELNRFKHRDPPERNLFKPAPVLFFANAPEEFTARDMYKALVVDCGAPVPIAIKFFASQGKGKQGLISFPDTKSAVEALIMSNFHRLGGVPLRLQFSGHPLGNDAEKFTPDMAN